MGRRLAVFACVAGLAGGGALVGYGLAGGPDDAPLPEQTFTLAASAPAPAADRSSEPQRVYPANRLVVEDLGIEAPVVPGPLDATGELVVPGDVSTVALWSTGPGLHAATGTSVLAGHVDKDGDLGALHPLYRITPNARVVVTDQSGASTRWQVVSLTVTPKDDLPAFTTHGPRRLAIVTCGGPVIHTPQGRRYADNVIAIAEPVNG